MSNPQEPSPQEPHRRDPGRQESDPPQPGPQVPPEPGPQVPPAEPAAGAAPGSDDDPATTTGPGPESITEPATGTRARAEAEAGTAPGPGSNDDPTGPSRFARAEPGRVEAFSDGVFAIAVTILVLEIHDPDHARNGLAKALLNQWPAYLGYLASFSYIAVIWLNHHQAFTRIRLVDRGLNAGNLLVLGTTAALAFPTGVVSDTLREESTGPDARAAVVLYALVAAAMCGSWLLLYTHLRRHPRLLDPRVEPTYVRHGQLRSAAGIAAYAAAGLLGYYASPVAALVVYLLVPGFYFATSEGFRRVRPTA